MDSVLYNDTSYDELAYIEGQVALREVNILLEQEETVSKIGLYGEAVGGILLGLLGFIKSAIGLILKIFIGFKGFIIALIVGFIARFVYKKIKGGVDSTGGGGGGGGGYSSGPLKNTGVSAKRLNVGKLKKDGFRSKYKFVSNSNLIKFLDEAKLQKLSKIKAPMEVLLTPATAETQPTEEQIEKAIEEVSEIVSDMIVEEVRVAVDEENNAAMVLPSEIDIKKLFEAIDECINNDTRPNGGSYSQIIKSTPFYSQVTSTHESDIGQLYNGTSKHIIPDIVSDFILNYDSAVAAALSIQIGLLTNVSKIVGNDNNINECIALFDELKASIPSDVLRNIGDLQKSFKEYKGQDFEKYVKPVFNKLRHKFKPKNYTDYAKVASLLSGYAKLQQKTTTTLKQSGIDCIDVYTDGDSRLITINLYGTSRSNHSGVMLLKRLKSVLSDSNFDIGKLKDSLSKLEGIGKKVQGVINSYKFDSDGKNSINVEESKKAIEFSISIVSCSASSATIASHFIAINNHPIYQAVQEDVVALIRQQVSDPEIYKVVFKK